MPLYEYQCTAEPHTPVTMLRKHKERGDPIACPECGAPMEPIFSAHHAQPDGIYSYCPNIGDPNKHARRNEQIAKREEAAKHGERINPVVDAE